MYYQSYTKTRTSGIVFIINKTIKFGKTKKTTNR